MKNSCKHWLGATVLFACLSIIATATSLWADTYEYDDLNRLTKIKYDNGDYIEYEYDAAGNIVGVFSPDMPPEAVCRDIAIPTDPGTCTAIASIDAGSSDPDDDLITLAQTPAGPYGPGITDVTLTVTDAHGAFSECSAAVTVADTEPPDLTCPEPLILECADPVGTPAAFSATATDNCTTDISAICTPPYSSLFPLGQSPVACSATDESGNSSSCNFPVTVQDTIPPIPDVTELPEIRGECSAEVTSTPTATDICAGFITGTTTDSLEYTEPATYTVTWAFTDSSGNESTQAQTVVVEDTTTPEISLTVSPDTLWPPNHKMVPIAVTITASDNCDPAPTIELTQITMNEGDYTTTFDTNYDDDIGDGNTSDDIQVDGDGNISLRAERAGKSDGRVYTITYTITDSSGNSTNESASVTVPHNQ